MVPNTDEANAKAQEELSKALSVRGGTHQTKYNIERREIESEKIKSCFATNSDVK